MVIECKNCSRRFKLNELLLKPSGSKIRLPVSIPVLCDVLDSDGKAKNFQLGAIKDISDGGVKVELFSRLVSGEVFRFFLNAQNRCNNPVLN
jgi:hypothetical protein